jgi:hypothetical protein
MKSLPLFIAFIGLSIAASATDFSISWFTIDGGGGTSTSNDGRWSVTGTAGQPDAAPHLKAGCFSVDPGFWGIVAAVPSDGAPELRIKRLGPFDVRVAFCASCRNWVLQRTTAFGTPPSSTVWTDVPDAELVLVGEELTRDYHPPTDGPRLFFRLRAR